VPSLCEWSKNCLRRYVLIIGLKTPAAKSNFFLAVVQGAFHAKHVIAFDTKSFPLPCGQLSSTATRWRPFKHFYFSSPSLKLQQQKSQKRYQAAVSLIFGPTLLPDEDVFCFDVAVNDPKFVVQVTQCFGYACNNVTSDAATQRPVAFHVTE